MSNRVDPTMHAVQPTTPNPGVDGRATQPGRAELRGRHHTMLPLGEPRHGQIRTRGENFLAAT